MTSETLEPGLDLPTRTEALESLLVERGLVDAKTIETFIGIYETQVGPMNGAKVVARAWTDPDYQARLLADGTAAIAELGFKGPQGEHIVVLENTPQVHHVVVCTLCSCYPWPVLGLPPAWYKDSAYRSRVVREPRAVLAEWGTEVGADVEVRVHDSSSEVRYLVLPERPAGTERPVGGGARRARHAATHGGRDEGGASRSTVVTAVLPELDVDGPAAPPRSNGELVFAEPWEGRAFGLRHGPRRPRCAGLRRVPRRADRPHRGLGGGAAARGVLVATTGAGCRRSSRSSTAGAGR